MKYTQSNLVWIKKTYRSYKTSLLPLKPQPNPTNIEMGYIFDVAGSAVLKRTQELLEVEQQEKQRQELQD